MSRISYRLHSGTRKAYVIIASTTKLVPPAKSRLEIQRVLIEMKTIQDQERVTGQLIELERKGDCKEEELVSNGDEQSDCKVVIIEGTDLGHDG